LVAAGEQENISPVLFRITREEKAAQKVRRKLIFMPYNCGKTHVYAARPRRKLKVLARLGAVG
jgi:hypothetical protein